MLCDRCGQREASGVTAKSWAASDGSTGDYPQQHWCTECFAEHRAETEARQREFKARLADGTIFDEIRADLATVRSDDPDALIRAAEFIDLIKPHLGVELPKDVQAFADRHRGPAA